MIPIYHLARPGDTAAPPGGSARKIKTSELPGDALCYLVAKGGIFKQVRNGFYSARIKVDGAGHLAELAEEVELHLPKLPLAILRRAEAFFRAAYEKYRSEAVVLLLANPESGQWRVEAPRQEVPGFGLHVAYDPASVHAPEGFLPFGTIHSHAACEAFHSGTDDLDEAHSDGLHITVGNVDRPFHSYAARWMIQGRAFPVELAEVVEGLDLSAPDPAWIERIKLSEKDGEMIFDENRCDFQGREHGLAPWPAEESFEPPFEGGAGKEYGEYWRGMYEREQEKYPIGMADGEFRMAE